MLKAPKSSTLVTLLVPVSWAGNRFGACAKLRRHRVDDLLLRRGGFPNARATRFTPPAPQHPR
jgi:hypothetical protein